LPTTKTNSGLVDIVGVKIAPLCVVNYVIAQF